MTAARKLVEPHLNNLFTLHSANSYLYCHFLYVSFVESLLSEQANCRARRTGNYVARCSGHLPLRMHLSRGEDKKVLLMAVGETSCATKAACSFMPRTDSISTTE